MMKSYTYSGNVPGAQVLAEILADLETAEARADTLAGDLSELRENVLLGLGMTAEAVASMDADGMESSITDLLAGHGELAAEVAWLKATLAEVDLSEWEDGRLKEWLPGAAEVEMVARLESRAENWKDAAAALRAKVERLEDELASETERLEDEAAMWQQTVTDLEADNATLRSDLVLSSDQGYELARLSALTGIVLHSTTPHEMTEEMAAAVAALRAQLDAAGEGWGPVDEWPADGALVEIRLTAQWDAEVGGFHVPPEMNGGLVLAAELAAQWRPAPPQE